MTDNQSRRDERDEMLALLGHELRNPLAPIVAALDLLKLKGGPSRELEVIERHVGRLTQLIADLLDVSRLARGKLVLQRETVPLEAAVQSALDATAPLHEGKAHAFTIEVPRELRVDADRLRLEQVLAHLIANAATYTPAGGSIVIRGVAQDTMAVISVKDSGRGIAPDLLPRVFEPFTRPAGSAEPGLGLGLAIVKNVVTLHGGSVTAISSGAGRGTEILMTWPLGHARPSRERAAARVPRRILIVDDNVDAAETLAEMLRLMGHEVVVVHDGATALATVASAKPEVALLDLSMPIMDGYELARRLRTHPELPKVSLVAVTGYGNERERDRARSAGFDHHLVKPLDADLLAQLIDED